MSWYPEDYEGSDRSFYQSNYDNYNNIVTAFTTYEHFDNKPTILYNGTQVINTDNNTWMSTSPIKYQGTAVPHFKFQGKDVLHKIKAIRWSTNNNNKYVRGTIGTWPLTSWSYGSPIRDYSTEDAFPAVNAHFDVWDGDVHYFYDEVEYTQTTGDTSYSSCASWVLDMHAPSQGDIPGVNFNNYKMSARIRVKNKYCSMYNFSAPTPDGKSSYSMNAGGIKVCLYTTGRYKDEKLRLYGSNKIRPFKNDYMYSGTNVTVLNLYDEYFSRLSSCQFNNFRGNWDSTGNTYIVTVTYACDDYGYYTPSGARYFAYLSFCFRYDYYMGVSQANFDQMFNNCVNCITHEEWLREDGFYDWEILSASTLKNLLGGSADDPYYVYPGIILPRALNMVSTGTRAYVEGRLTTTGAINQFHETFTPTKITYTDRYTTPYPTDGTGISRYDASSTALFKTGGAGAYFSNNKGDWPRTFDRYSMQNNNYEYSRDMVRSAFSFAGIWVNMSGDIENYGIPALKGRGIDKKYQTSDSDWDGAMLDFAFSSCTFDISESYKEWATWEHVDDDDVYTNTEPGYFAQVTSCAGYKPDEKNAYEYWDYILQPSFKFVNYPVIDVLPEYNTVHMIDFIY